jgi:hypothetical protein
MSARKMKRTVPTSENSSWIDLRLYAFSNSGDYRFDHAHLGVRRNDPRQLQSRAAEQIRVLGFSPLLAPGHHQHVQIQELRERNKPSLP